MRKVPQLTRPPPATASNTNSSEGVLNNKLRNWDHVLQIEVILLSRIGFLSSESGISITLNRVVR